MNVQRSTMKGRVTKQLGGQEVSGHSSSVFHAHQLLQDLKLRLGEIEFLLLHPSQMALSVKMKVEVMVEANGLAALPARKA